MYLYTQTSVSLVFKGCGQKILTPIALSAIIADDTSMLAMTESYSPYPLFTF